MRALVLLLLLAACAGGVQDPRREFQGPGRDRLFVSPSGEPFRAQPGGSPPLPTWFAGADGDGDGAITAAEFRRDGDRWFARLAGADAVIDGFEVSAYETDILPEMGPDGRGGDRPTAPRTDGSEIQQLPDYRDRERRNRLNLDGAGPFGLTGEPHPIMSADFDQSRRIEPAEFRRASDERFRLLDRAGDGRLTLAELASIQPPRRTGRRSRPAPQTE